MLTGLAVAVAFRARFWNIGGEGQLYAGAMAAAFFGAQPWLPGRAALAGDDPVRRGGRRRLGAAAGASCGSRFKVDDVVTTLLLNFVMLYGMSALLDGPWKDPRSGYPTSPPIRADGRVPDPAGHRAAASRRPAGAARVAVVWFVMRRTTLGFAIRAVGENARAARLCRHPGRRRTILAAAALSGALAGLAGVGEVGGVHYQVMADLSPGYGYTGIVIAMLARLEPARASCRPRIFFAAIITGAEGMSRATGVPVFLADVIQGVSLLCHADGPAVHALPPARRGPTCVTGHA